MARKKITEIKTDDVLSPVEKAIEESTTGTTRTRKVHTIDEAEEMAARFEAGEPINKLPRINLALQPDNFLYVKVMSKARSENITDFINEVLRMSKERNAARYEALRQIRDDNSELL